MDTKNFKINCSSIGALMGNAQGNNPVTDKEFKELFNLLGRDYEQLSELQKFNAREIMTKEIKYEPLRLSDTTTSELAKIYAFERYGKSKLSKGNDSPASLEKGTLAEPVAIKMLSDHDGIRYVKNEELFDNKWLKGIPDVIIKNTKGKVQKIIEVKISFDMPSFLCSIMRKEDTDNLLETMGYMDILNCENAEIVHCLVDMPHSMIVREETRMMELYEDFGLDKELAIQRFGQRKNSMVFPEFTIAQKIFRRPVTLNKLTMKDVKRRVTRARSFIQEMNDNFIKPLNLPKS